MTKKVFNQNKTSQPDQRSFFQKIRDQFLTWFGDVKVFKPLPFLPPIIPIYDPGSYNISAQETRDLESILEPGDILLRGYTNYLDGMIIPGFFSHAGIYLGAVSEADLNSIGQSTLKQVTRNSKFATGAHMVAHSMAEGVFTEDLIGFCRADFMAVLRIPRTVVACSGQPPYSYAQEYSKTAEALLQQQLLATGTSGIDFMQEAWPVIRSQALSQLGCHYDFGFDFDNFNDMSCTEYVHWCVRCLQASHGIRPQTHRIFMVKRNMISPDDILMHSQGLLHVWHSKSIPAKQLAKLKWNG